jgi:type II secretion system protein N
VDELEPLSSGFENTTYSKASEVEEFGSSKFRRFGILVFGICAFFFFLMLKLPEARIQNLVIAHMRIIAQEQGLLFSAEKVRIGIIFGPAIKLYNVEFKAIENERQVLKVPFLRVSPNILSLLSKTKSASISAELLNGEISGTVGAGPTTMLTNLSIDSIDLGATQLLKRFLPVDLSGKINGKIKLDLDTELPQKSDGGIKLKIEKLNLPAQNVMGFNLPKINVNETVIDITITQGQFVIREFNLGKDTKSDDVVARVTGQGTLEHVLDRSKINAKAVFELSPSVIQSFPLLDALLGQAKGADGKFTYRVSGPLSALDAQPGA